jgi:hypothetical protein
VLPIRACIRRYLGTDHLEEHVTSMLELLNGLVAKTTEASAAQQASFLNLHNGMNRLTQQVTDLRAQLAAGGEVTEDMQVLANSITESLSDMRKAADTADDGFEPIEEPVVVEPGVEPANPEVPAEVPADETPTVPAEGQPVTDEGTSSRKR